MILAVAERILREVLEPTLKGMAAEGRPFVGGDCYGTLVILY